MSCAGDSVLRDSNRKADSLMRIIESQRLKEFKFWPNFRYPVDDGLGYKHAIAMGYYYAYYTAMFHSFISWVDFPEDEELRGRGPYEYRYRIGSAGIGRAEKDLDEWVSNLSDNRTRTRNEDYMKNLVRLIRPDTWPFLASCLFEAFKENQDSSSLSKTVVTDLISEDDFEKFNHYFKYYVGSIAKSLKKVLESEDTLEMVQLTYELAKSEIKSINYNQLQPTLYYFVLQLETVLMKPDINELWTTLNQTDYFVQETSWKFITGRWPDMVTFVDNFLRRTSGSIVFWDRLTGQFLPEMKNKIPHIPHMMNDVVDVDKFVDHFDELFELFMDMIADGDEASIRQIFDDIRGSKWDEIATSYIQIIAEELTRFEIVLSHIQTELIFLVQL